MAILNAEAWKEKTAHALLEVYLALYDRLIDDDEDVRDVGAEIVSKLVSEPSNGGNGPIRNRSLSVPAARLKLLQFMYSNYESSTTLWTEAVRRLVPSYKISQQSPEVRNLPTDSATTGDSAAGFYESNLIRFSPVREVLGQAMMPDTALFVEEKQNLYIDEVQEARVWSQMLIDLKPWRETMYLNARLHDWTIDGLSVLSQTVEKDSDGPLGWISKPAVFAIGMRVILAARVQLCRKNGAVSSKVKELYKERLQRLLTVGLKNHLHEIWITEVQDILSTAE